MKILIADDEPDIRDMLREYFTLHGHEVLEARHGFEALLHVRRARPEAVVLDLRMPRLGGVEALTRIQKFDASIRVVVVTAEVDEAVHREAERLGARAVLKKPVALPELLAALGAAPAPDTEGPTDASGVAPAPAPPDRPGGPGRTRILIIDDDDGVRDVLAEFLTTRGYDVAEAARTSAGTAAIADRAPDVILLDIDMPGLSGADALPTIRAMAPRAAVIMISGTNDQAVAKRTLAFGAFDYLVKPIDLEYLTQSLDSASALRELEA
jgi:DNA-binding NtrC family response regulator